MTTNRWYTFGRKVALAEAEIGIIRTEPGTVYQVTGWSRTREAAIAKRDKLDVQGRAGIMVFSPSRQQAMADVMEVYDGVVVEGYISPADKRAGRAIVKAAVMREIFCPFTGNVLDMRRALVIVTESNMYVCSAAHWDTLDQEARGYFLRIPGVTVYDGRELFK